MTENVLTQFPDGRILLEATFSGATYGTTNGITQAISSLRKIERVLSVGVSGVYLSDPQKTTVSGSTLHVHVYEVNKAVNEGGTATYTVTITEVATGTSLSSVNFRAMLLGF